MNVLFALGALACVVAIGYMLAVLLHPEKF
jgi:hypothetical protein